MPFLGADLADGLDAASGAFAAWARRGVPAPDPRAAESLPDAADVAASWDAPWPTRSTALLGSARRQSALDERVIEPVRKRSAR